MTRVILVRHGRSMANAENIFAGHLDADLHEDGHLQAKLTAEYIAENYKVDRVYSSDLKRAFFTAGHIADRLGLEVTPDKSFREIDAGEWDGKVFYDLPTLYPEDFAVWYDDIGNAVCTGGESVRGLGERIMSALERVALENEGKTVLVASHATPIRSAVTIVKYGDVSEMEKVEWPSNASVTVLERENGRWSLVVFSEDSHLKEYKTSLPNNV